jgi:hypothetical protein
LSRRDARRSQTAGLDEVAPIYFFRAHK